MPIDIPERYQKYISIATNEAQTAFNNDEIPVGSVIVKDDKILSRAHNLIEKNKDITAHSEMIAIKRAIKKQGKFLNNCLIFTTLEPCPMCLSAIIYSRIEKIVYLVKDPIWGALGGLYDLRTFLHHSNRPISEFIYYKPAEELIKQFFKSLRIKK